MPARPRPLAPLLGLGLALGCSPQPAASVASAPAVDEHREASGPSARWTYEIRVDEALEHMQLGLCIEGPRPRRIAAGREAINYVERARVRGGPALARDGDALVVETLGEHGCVDLEIDLDAATASDGRDSARVGDSLMIAPDRWLWYPSVVPDDVDAQARFELPEGVSATVPWPEEGRGFRRLDHTSFGWNAWIAIGRHQPLTFEVGQCEFEVAILDGERAASDAGIEAWLRTAAQTSVELYGRFPRDRVAVIVVPSSGWRGDPVLFGMARRGGGGSAMLVLNAAARDDELPGEWVASHELLHLGMPLVADPWMSEGFVTYYTQILRGRQGVLGPNEDDSIRAALGNLESGFRRGRGGTRSLARASANMRSFGGYTRVYWGGAAVAFDLDRSLRVASSGRRSLDDLMRMLETHAPVHRRWQAEELVALMDAEVARWREAQELTIEISPSAIVGHHLTAKAIPGDVERLEGLALEVHNGEVRLLPNPKDEARLRAAMFESRQAPAPKR